MSMFIDKSIIIYVVTVRNVKGSIIRFNINFSWFLESPGEAYSAAGYQEEAEQWYKESLKSKPDHLPAHLTYAKHLNKVVCTCIVQ